MTRRLAPFAAFAGFVGLVGCGLSSSGTMPSDDAGIVDVAADRITGLTDAGLKCTCLPSPGAGWTYVAYERDGTDACTGPFAAAPRAAVEALAAPADCQCGCLPANPTTCTVKSIAATTFQSANCSTNVDLTLSGSPPDQTCWDWGPKYTVSGPLSIKGSPTFNVTPGTCGLPSQSKTLPPVDVHTGQACALVAGVGGGCAASSDCVPDPTAKFTTCVLSDQPDAACPAGYPVKRRVGAAVADTRDCGPACTCTPAPTCTADAQLYQDNGCTGTKKEGQSFALDGLCHVISSSGVSADAIGMTVTVNQKCNSAGYQPTGSVGSTLPYTICCP